MLDLYIVSIVSHTLFPPPLILFLHASLLIVPSDLTYTLLIKSNLPLNSSIDA